MLNPELKLNSKMFNDDVEQVPIRKGFGLGLVLAAEENKNVVGLCADLAESTQMHLFAKKFPERFIEVGVAEQNLATVASGLAAMGKISFFSSYATFSPGRNWEQIRTTICYNDRPCIAIGSHAGISVGPDGGSHQALEDIALMRVLPNMVVVSPCDALEAKKATIALAKLGKPAYLRLTREATPIMTTEETPFEIGKINEMLVSDAPQIMILATGALVHQALLAGRELEKQKINSVVLNVSTVKPLDTETILKWAKQVKGVVTVEEHQVAGGLGSAVAELLAEKYPLPMRFIGVRDQFGQSGTPQELLKHYGLSEKEIIFAAKHLL